VADLPSFLDQPLSHWAERAAMLVRLQRVVSVRRTYRQG
jgi:hypothetical protein